MRSVLLLVLFVVLSSYVYAAPTLGISAQEAGTSTPDFYLEYDEGTGTTSTEASGIGATQDVGTFQRS